MPTLEILPRVPPIIVVVALWSCSSTAVGIAGRSLEYPVARRSDVTDKLHGELVADPYRWLEDLASVETRAWIRAEAAVTRRWFEGIASRERITRELVAANDFERASFSPKKRGTFLLKTTEAAPNGRVIAVDVRTPARSAWKTIVPEGATAMYPAILVVTGENETRVAPWHSFKFVAALQAAQCGSAPILLHLEPDAGHFGAVTQSARLSNEAAVFTFIRQALDAPLR